MVMNKKNCFSLPINPKLSPEYLQTEFLNFLKRNKDYIYDLYFTARMPPFNQDAMGDVFLSAEDEKNAIENSIWISNQSDIPLSATFNNLQIRPSQENLDIFIANFKILYEYGVKIITVPHTSWVMTGQIQKEFPDIFIKNTILREVTKANEIVSLAKAGFNYINLDRDLMRDQDQLRRLKEAKEYCASIGKPVKFSMLANEGCWGGCPIMPEHYHYNSTRGPVNAQYFNDSISRVSCHTWDHQDTSASLKSANLPPWKKDWEQMVDLGIDVFKMHGREAATRLRESMDIVERWRNNEDLLFPTFNDYIEDLSLSESPIDIWREKIKTCKFDCWDCNYCESVVDSRLKKQSREQHPYVKKVIESISNSAKNISNFDELTYNIPGLSSNRVRHLLNNLCQIDDAVYMEVGVYTGSTFYAALQNNSIKAYAIDHFQAQNITPERDDVEWQTNENPFISFVENSKTYIGNNSIKLLEKEASFVSVDDIHPEYKPNIIFYDGNHDYEEQLNCLNSLLCNFTDTFILVIDDANIESSVTSTDEFIRINNLSVLYEKKILHNIEDFTQWWNGLYILILSKNV